MMVNGGMPATTYINNHSGSMGAGDMRFNTLTQNMEVYDGNSWIQLGTSHAQLGLTPEAERLLDWARMKMMEELELDALAEKNETIADLVKQRKELDHKIKMVQTLVK